MIKIERCPVCGGELHYSKLLTGYLKTDTIWCDTCHIKARGEGHSDTMKQFLKIAMETGGKSDRE